MSSLSERIENINDQVKIREIVDYYGIETKDGGDETQIVCPFHTDSKPSARIYLDNGFWCFACSTKRLSLIDFVMQKSTLPIDKACAFVEKTFNVDTNSVSIDGKKRDYISDFNKATKEKEKPKIDPEATKREEVIANNFPKAIDTFEEKVIEHRERFNLDKYTKILYAIDVIRYQKEKNIKNPVKILATLMEKVKPKLEDF